MMEVNQRQDAGLGLTRAIFLSGCYINVSLCNMKRRDVTLTVANRNMKIRKVLCNELSLYKTKVN